MKQVTDAERLQKVLDVLDLTANKLAEKLEYKSAGSVYHVLDGINNLSKGMCERIVTRFPKINYMYLRKGEGEVVLKGQPLQNQLNVFNIARPEDTESDIKKMLQIPDKLDIVIEKLDQIINKKPTE